MVCMSKIAPCGDQNVYKCKNDAFLVRSNSRRAAVSILPRRCDNKNEGQIEAHLTQRVQVLLKGRDYHELKDVRPPRVNLKSMNATVFGEMLIRERFRLSKAAIKALTMWIRWGSDPSSSPQVNVFDS